MNVADYIMQRKSALRRRRPNLETDVAGECVPIGGRPHRSERVLIVPVGHRRYVIGAVGVS